MQLQLWHLWDNFSSIDIAAKTCKHVVWWRHIPLLPSLIHIPLRYIIWWFYSYWIPKDQIVMMSKSHANPSHLFHSKLQTNKQTNKLLVFCLFAHKGMKWNHVWNHDWRVSWFHHSFWIPWLHARLKRTTKTQLFVSSLSPGVFPTNSTVTGHRPPRSILRLVLQWQLNLVHAPGVLMLSGYLQLVTWPNRARKTRQDRVCYPCARSKKMSKTYDSESNRNVWSWKLATRFDSQNMPKNKHSDPMVNLYISKVPSWSDNKSVLAEQLHNWSPNGSGHRTSADGAHWPWTLRPRHMAWPCVVLWSGNALNPERCYYQVWCHARLSLLSASALASF